jgi:hypothetical protein
MSNIGYSVNIVTCLLKAGIAELVKMFVARQWLHKHVSTATKSRDPRENRRIVGSSVFSAVRPEAIYR